MFAAICLSKWCPPRCNDATRYFIGKCACFHVRTLQQDSGCDLNKMFVIGFALKSRISKITNIKNILIVTLIQS